MAVYSEAVVLAPVLFVCTKYLSLSGGSRSEGRDGAFDFPVFAVLGRPLPALLELALK